MNTDNNNNNITVNDKPLKEWIELEKVNEITSNYRNELGTLCKSSHKPIITKSKCGNIKYEKGGEVKIYTEKEILEKYDALVKPHNKTIKNIFEVLKLKGRASIKEIAHILKKSETSVRQRIDYVRRKTKNKIISKEKIYFYLTDNSISVEDAYLLFRCPDKIIENENIVKVPENTCSDINDINTEETIKNIINKYMLKTISSKNNELNINVNVFVRFGLLRR